LPPLARKRGGLLQKYLPFFIEKNANLLNKAKETLINYSVSLKTAAVEIKSLTAAGAEQLRYKDKADKLSMQEILTAP